MTLPTSPLRVSLKSVFLEGKDVLVIEQEGGEWFYKKNDLPRTFSYPSEAMTFLEEYGKKKHLSVVVTLLDKTEKIFETGDPITTFGPHQFIRTASYRRSPRGMMVPVFRCRFCDEERVLDTTDSSVSGGACSKNPLIQR